MPSSQATWPSSFQWEVYSSRWARTARASSGPCTDWRSPGTRRASARATTGRSSALLGMQAQYEHSPPTSSLSTTAQLRPAARTRSATFSPTGPAPSTTTSYSSASVIGTVWCAVYSMATGAHAKDGIPRRRTRLCEAVPPRGREEVCVMATVELTKENFDSVVSENGFVLIDFWASWCGPCRQFAPVYEAASERHDDLVFAKVDTEAQQELAQAFDIRSIPTLMIVRDNVAVFAQPGALPEAALEDVIGQARGLDMDEVRKSVEAAQQK